MNNEDYPKIPFKEFQTTTQYTNLVEEVQKDNPQVDPVTLEIMICGWYCKEILGLELPKTVKPEPIKGSVKAIKSYTKEEHIAEFGNILEEYDNKILLNAEEA
jgi:hypothetical protein